MINFKVFLYNFLLDIWDIIVVYALVYAPFLIMMFVQKKLNFGYDTRRKATILEASLQKILTVEPK